MKCPLCGHTEDKVVESRQGQSASTIRRRRECMACEYRYTTYEHIEEVPIKVIKKSGRREVFDPKKVEAGMCKALGKWAMAHNAMDTIIHEIEDRAAILSRSTNEIRTITIGGLVLEQLWNIDRTAYIRFASIHEQFKSTDDFLELIKKMEAGDTNTDKPAVFTENSLSE